MSRSPSIFRKKTSDVSDWVVSYFGTGAADMTLVGLRVRTAFVLEEHNIRRVGCTGLVMVRVRSHALSSSPFAIPWYRPRRPKLR